MKYTTLGSSGLAVSSACLGSMTWGFQNNQAEADEQIAYALEQRINFIDTAELYAVPPTPETYGKTEAIIGHWFSRNQEKRQNIVLASKIAGSGMPWIRNGDDISGKTVIEAIDGSLKRLQTDYIDIYQLHWPNRTSPHFGKHAPGQISFSDVDKTQATEEMLDILQALDKSIKAGKIRHYGLSDDTTWGINTYLSLSKEHNLPKPVSIQNEFSLLHAKDWPYLIENCVHENIAYLPWSPLATGMLSGKYANGNRPEGSRWSFSHRHGLFRDTEPANKAVDAYAKIAKKHGYTPSQLALAWCNQVDGVTSTIIGATNMQQLKENIEAFNKPLSNDVINEISAVLKTYLAPF